MPSLLDALFHRFLQHRPVRSWLFEAIDQPTPALAKPLLDRSVAFVCDFPLPADWHSYQSSFALGELMIPVRIYGSFVLAYLLSAQAVHKTFACLSNAPSTASPALVSRRCVVEVSTDNRCLSLLEFSTLGDRSLLVTAKQFPFANTDSPVRIVVVRYPDCRVLNNHNLLINFVESRCATAAAEVVPQPKRALRKAKRTASLTNQPPLPVTCASANSALPVLLRVLSVVSKIRVKSTFKLSVMAQDARYGAVREMPADFHIAADSQMTALRQVASLTASFSQPHNTATTTLNHLLPPPDVPHSDNLQETADILAALAAAERVQHKSALGHRALPQPATPTHPPPPPHYAPQQHPVVTSSAPPSAVYAHPMHPAVDATKQPPPPAYAFDYSPVSAATSASPPLLPDLPQLAAPNCLPAPPISSGVLPAPSPHVSTPYGLSAPPPPVHIPVVASALGGSSSASGSGVSGDRSILDKFFPSAVPTCHTLKRARAPAGSGICNECGKCFFKSGALARHIRTAHAGAMRMPHSSLGAERLECPRCDKTFSQQGSLNRHLRSIHEARKLHCRYCSLSFGQAFDLKRHQRRKHPNEVLFVPPEALPAPAMYRGRPRSTMANGSI